MISPQEELRKEMATLGLKVSSMVPNPRPSEFIRLSSGGGVIIDSSATQALFIAEVYAASTERVFELSLGVVDLFTPYKGEVFDDVEVSWPVSYPDPVSNSPRCTLNVQCFFTH